MGRISKSEFVKKFGEAVREAGIGVEKLEYLEENEQFNDGTVYQTQEVLVHYVNGHTKRINVFADSHYAIMIDVIKHVLD